MQPEIPNENIEKINELIQRLPSAGKVSDGYHTFDELYDHRIALWIALCKSQSCIASWQHDRCSNGVQDAPNPAWRTQRHSDGELAFGGGWFVLGMYKGNAQMTYHLPMSYWDECDFAETLEKAPDFDGHTSADVLKRLDYLEY